ncbi:hypothetical protein [Nesterenkonia sp. Act20]|uniref:hypothetical protein n=1 Tax=Nesterenkonia sp. Act20 TaxID=1483432 RepID=UPI001C47A69E|nr:hypothetical protein [Nesterenkonia sp. Act20]
MGLTEEVISDQVRILKMLHAEERGDVPGWVMITLMSAVLVAGLLAIAQPALQGLFNDAINQVSR